MMKLKIKPYSLLILLSPLIFQGNFTHAQWTPANHACDATSDFGTLTSTNVINPAFSCCWNGTHRTAGAIEDDPVSSSEKLDCKAYDSPLLTDNFDTVWTQTMGGGEAPLATRVAGPMGTWVTGFFDLNGRRCDQFSEFATADMVSGLVNSNMVNTGQMLKAGATPVAFGFTANTSPVAVPTATWYGTIASTLALPAPYAGGATSQTAYQCPILIRAVSLPVCPTFTVGTGVPATGVPVSYNDGAGVRHCAKAASIIQRIKIQQLYMIGGKKPIATKELPPITITVP